MGNVIQVEGDFRSRFDLNLARRVDLVKEAKNVDEERWRELRDHILEDKKGTRKGYDNYLLISGPEHVPIMYPGEESRVLRLASRFDLLEKINVQMQANFTRRALIFDAHLSYTDSTSEEFKYSLRRKIIYQPARCFRSRAVVANLDTFYEEVNFYLSERAFRDTILNPTSFLVTLRTSFGGREISPSPRRLSKLAA